jgi:phage shock protein PspC (stress-responsive transcriptional regulator)
MKRDLGNKVLFGVCSGLGRDLNINPTTVRLGFVLGIVFFGTGLGLYLILLIIMLIAENAH